MTACETACDLILKRRFTGSSLSWHMLQSRTACAFTCSNCVPKSEQEYARLAKADEWLQRCQISAGEKFPGAAHTPIPSHPTSMPFLIAHDLFSLKRLRWWAVLQSKSHMPEATVLLMARGGLQQNLVEPCHLDGAFLGLDLQYIM